MSRRFHASTMVVSAALVLALSARWCSAEPQRVGPDPQQYHRVVGRAIHYLKTQAQAADGSFSASAGPGITALVITALLRNGESVDDQAVARGLRYLQGFVQKDGGIHAPDSKYKNYETSISLMCFVAANKDHRFNQIIHNAERFLKGLQWHEAQGKTRSDMFYGGTGYGHEKRPDLSNTGMFIDALVAAGDGPDDEAIRRALVFVSRCQNLETIHNDTRWAVKNPDGGFYYSCAAGGKSEAKWPEGESEEVRGLRSYGSMTYMGLKSLIYAGLKADDPRVKAATTWVRKNYDLNANPGLGPQGLYYYYHTFAKTLDSLGEDQFADASGVKHDWRRELTGKLAELQKPDGSWLNPADRWMEGDPNLVTGFALLSLSYCQPKIVANNPAGR